MQLTVEPLMLIKANQKVNEGNLSEFREGEHDFNLDSRRKEQPSGKKDMNKCLGEKLEVIGKTRRDLQASEQSHKVGNMEQYDSDERPLCYKQTNLEKESEEEDESLNVGSLKKRKDEQLDEKLNLTSVASIGMTSLGSVSENGGALDDKIQQAHKESNSSLQNASGESNRDEIDFNSALISPQQSETLADDYLISVSKFKDKSAFSDKPEEETFGDDISDDDDESPHIDWNTFALPTRLTDTLEDRMQLYSGQKMGFHSEIAAQVQAASQQFLMNKGSSVETFLGVGENEEFGDSESESEQ